MVAMVSDLSVINKAKGKRNAVGGLFAAIRYTTNTKITKKRHGVTQKADGINTIPVKHQNAPAEKRTAVGTRCATRRCHGNGWRVKI
mgnify:CR=1 FL=1